MARCCASGRGRLALLAARGARHVARAQHHATAYGCERALCRRRPSGVPGKAARGGGGGLRDRAPPLQTRQGGRPRRCGRAHDQDGGAGRRRGPGEEIIARPARPQLGAAWWRRAICRARAGCYVAGIPVATFEAPLGGKGDASRHAARLLEPASQLARLLAVQAALHDAAAARFRTLAELLQYLERPASARWRSAAASSSCGAARSRPPPSTARRPPTWRRCSGARRRSPGSPRR